MIKFRMFGIHADQFAILSKSAPLEDLGLGVNINYKYANKGRIISCSTEFNFLNSTQEKIMILAITCEFEIDESDYKKLIITIRLLFQKNYWNTLLYIQSEQQEEFSSAKRKVLHTIISSFRLSTFQR